MPRGKRERTYRGIFATSTGEQVGLDFYAENLSFAWDHARQVAAHDALHQGLVLRLLRVFPVDKTEFRTGDAGSWFPWLVVRG
jgi:hypothetical protein